MTESLGVIFPPPAELCLIYQDFVLDSTPYPLRGLSQVRSVVETMSESASRPSSLFTEAYGKNVYKCCILSCSRFLAGFKTKKVRDQHLLTHRGRFECIHEGCDYSIYGFSTKQQLAKHLDDEHSILPSEAIFPKVQRCSLKVALYDAIDNDNALAVKDLIDEAFTAETSPSLLSGNHLLTRALKKRSREAIKTLLHVLPTGKDMNQQIKSTLNFAVTNDDEDLVRLVLEVGANTDPKISYPFASFLAAARRGWSHILRLLLRLEGKNFDDVQWKCRKLFAEAAKSGDEEVLSVLLDFGGVDYVQSSAYYGSIKNAAFGGHESAVRWLLSKGLELNAEKKYPIAVRRLAPDVNKMLEGVMQEVQDGPKPKVKALQIRASKNISEEVLRLLEKGVEINHPIALYGSFLGAVSSAGNLSVVQELLDRGADVNGSPFTRDTALEQAVAQGHSAVVKLLIEQGARVNSTNEASSHKNSALHLAAHDGHETIVRLLLEGGADVNARNSDRYTVLQLAASRGHEKIVRLLLKEGVDVNAANPNDNLNAALPLAASGGHETIVKLLLGGGADINARDSNDNSALYLAAGNGHEKIVNLLLKEGADINAANQFRETALHLAARNGYETIVVNLLLKEDADINAANQYRETALHLAVLNGHEITVKLLLENGANINAADQSNNTVLQYAMTFKHTDVVRILLENGAERYKS